MKHALQRGVAVLIVAMLCLGGWVRPVAGATDSRGSEFWLAFPSNYNSAPDLRLFVTGPQSTTGTVTIPGLGFTSNFSVTANQVTTVTLPATAQTNSSDGVEARGIRVTALDEVTVYGLNRIQFTTDAYLALPADILGTDYVVLGYGNSSPGGSLFTVVATQNSTAVTVTPRVTTGSRAAGTPYTINMNQGQTYQLVNNSNADLSGSTITSTKPVAVFGGHRCANVPNGFGYCDHLVEQLPPTSAWGRSFATMPLATRLRGDTFRFVAATNGTQVSVNGTVAAILNRGQVHERIVSGPAHITSNEPILVAQYSNGSSFDNVTSDPFMMLVPPYEQFLADYTVTTPASGFRANFVNVIAPTAAVGSVRLDGTPIPASSFTNIGATGFSGARVNLALGSHHLTGTLPFGVFVYGFDSYDSYGYPGGMSLSPVATVTSVSLAPKTATKDVGDQHCVTATVTDQIGNGLEGVRVDFAVTGANEVSGFGSTSSAGEAQYCYIGANDGGDTITATVGNLADTASATFSGNQVPSVDAGPDVEGDEGSPIALDGTVTDDINAASASWTITGAGADCALADATAVDTTVTCDDNGVFTATLTANDGVNTSVQGSAQVTVRNLAPVQHLLEPAAGAVFPLAATVTVKTSFTDAGAGDTHTCQVGWGDGATTAGTVVGGNCEASHNYSSGGHHEIRVTLTDDDGGSDTDAVTVFIDTPPRVDAGPDASGFEGSPIALHGSVTDDRGAASSWTITPGADVDTGATCTVDPTGPTGGVTCTDNGTFTATLSADDGVNPVVSDSATVTILNVAPVLGAITGPSEPAAVNTRVLVRAPFSDAGRNDTHTCSVDWGDGATTSAVVAGGNCSGEHIYASAGVYTVAMTVADDDGGLTTQLFQYVVVYDPDAGFVTGGGWIDSPAGAYRADPGLAGKANFGFVSKYQKGATVPTGNTQFQFQSAGFNFHSTSYNWLVISGPKAQYKGTGKVNGEGDYGFLLTANDGQATGGGGVDRFRLKIWDKVTGAVVYDNQAGNTDDAAASDTIEGGSIVIHAKK